MSMSTITFQDYQETGRMASRSKGNRIRPYRRLCQEKFACSGDPAVYECDECGTLQCDHCEKNLHQLPKFLFHDRQKLIHEQEQKMCGVFCNPPNDAVIRCEECDIFMCADCDAKLHSKGKKRTHERKIIQLTLSEQSSRPASQPKIATPKQEHPDNNDDFKSADFITCHFSINKSPPAKPSSPAQSKTSPIAIPGKAAIITPLDISHPHTAVAMVTPHPSEEKIKKEEPSPTLPATLELAGPQLQKGIEEANFDEMQGKNGMDVMGEGSMASSPKDDVKEFGKAKMDLKGFLLVDDTEKLQVASAEDFITRLNCRDDDTVKVVSIFGNTGDGKSHTLNHAFYKGQEVFHTSASQDSCTIGVWAAFDSSQNVITLDTEGLLGVSPNENQRTRLLLKVLAISDIIIYRTCADRLHSDLFRFLGDASHAYSKHFADALKAASDRWKMEVPLQTLGPAVIVFHETKHTDPLGIGNKTPVMLLKERFKTSGLNIDAFSSLHYVGIKTTQESVFTTLQQIIKQNIDDKSVRSPRSPAIIYQTLKVLNNKFNEKIQNIIPDTFPDEYFSCSSKCLSCGERCVRSMNHIKDNLSHDCKGRCKYQHQYENKVYTCKKCYEGGDEVIVVPKTSASVDTSWMGLAKYAWSGYVLECPKCGIIYRSRQYWYGNRDPVETVVRTEIRHVWPGGNPVLQGTHNAARKLLDGISHVAGTVGYMSATPTKMLSDWMTDQIAPAYWIPNSQIHQCAGCQHKFAVTDTKHHCRACGQGFCDDCTTNTAPVPERGWGETPVRVCDECYNTICCDDNESTIVGDPESHPVTARKVGEVIGSTFSLVATAIEYPKGLVIDAARPTYWRADCEIEQCCCCKEKFGPKLVIHHCRACGDGVCELCSSARKAVPSRGWDHPVRVCKECYEKDDL
ncbi:zinc finger FYVE domain-containing protein 1-like [Saccoglossus kowalevskii]